MSAARARAACRTSPCSTTLAIGYGILTVENEEQAWARAQLDQGNKGGEAAQACLAMVDAQAPLPAVRAR